MADLREMIQAPLDSALFANARLRFNEGRFHDCGSGTCMFRLLKAFIRELPAPLVPRTFYDEVRWRWPASPLPQLRLSLVSVTFDTLIGDYAPIL